MNDDDLIRRGDALAVAAAVPKSSQNMVKGFIAALPAAQVAVKPLVWEDPCKRNNEVHVARCIFGEYYIHIDGGRHSAWLEAHVKPYENRIGIDVGSVYEAQALADADYAARIRAVLEPAPAPDVAGLVEALRDISRQNKTDELNTEYDVEFADFEAGYDACISRARAALAEWGQANG
jgi:hypothetical protein